MRITFSQNSGSRYIVSLLIFVLISGCVAHQADLGYREPELSEITVQSIEYDKMGLPHFTKRLNSHPSNPGDRFTIARFSAGRPVVSYDVMVKRGKPDMGKPFETIYEWTGKGFEAGGQVTQAMAGGLRFNVEDSRTAVVGLAIIVTPLAVGTVGGFVVGVVDGIHQTAVEMSKIATTREQVMSVIDFEYDGQNRLHRMLMFTPDRTRELVETGFEYRDNETQPFRTVVKSKIEGRDREILRE